MAVTVDTGWKPTRFSVSSSSRTADGELSTISLRHHMVPFPGELKLSGGVLAEQSLQKLAFTYISALKQNVLADLPQQWLEALGSDADDSNFGWMPIGWPPKAGHEGDVNAGDPFVSFRLERKATNDKATNGEATKGQIEQTVMLLAAERLAGKFIGSGLGLCVVVSLRSRAQESLDAQIVGVSASLPYGQYKNGLPKADWATSKIKQADLLKMSLSDDVRRNIEVVLGLTSVAVRGTRYFRVDGSDEWQVERYGTGKRRSAPGEVTAYSFLMAGTATSAGTLVGTTLLQADAVADAHIFAVDSASQGTNAGYGRRRPSRTDAELAGYTTNVSLPTDPTALEFFDAGGRELMRVVSCPNFVLADKSAGGTDPKTVKIQGAGPKIHSDDFSAVSAFYNARQIFNRMIAYGLDPFDYFRFASLPLRVAYRSGMQAGPGKNGQIINACVKVDGWPFDFIGPTAIGDRPGVEMRLALADLSRRGRKSWDQSDPSVAEPFGIAADDRWIWHEAGHVLLVAAAGELEFRFAHSAGDSLAAVALDPVSDLDAADHGGASYWRGMTFPWVFTPRRHDRCVRDGWSWGGAMHRDLADVPDSIARRKGYLSEQILSSSLFRLYRLLGGDTFEDPSIRQTASHYCVFLIMDAMRRLGIAPAVSLHNDPEQLVAALLDADAAALEWLVTLSPGTTYRRVGGCAYKAIRWAFEAQGLYAPAGGTTNAPGLPPAVDVYIASGRGTETNETGSTAYGPGSYAPVSLYWDPGQQGNEPAPPPLWQAAATAISIQADGIHVVVGNRGTEDAQNVQVNAFWIEWPSNQAPPNWNDSGWNSSGATAAQGVPAGHVVPFGPLPFAGAAGRRYIVVAKAACADDPASPDTASFACSYMPTRLVDLIAGDNNLGLRVVTLAEHLQG